MRGQPAAVEVLALHAVTWWCLRTLGSQLPVLHYWAPDSAGWWLIRLARASLVVGILLAWAALRGVKVGLIGLGGHGFWRNGCIALLTTAALWLAVAVLRGKGVLGPHPLAFPRRELALRTTFVDVLAQQVSTFGLLQGLLGPSAQVAIFTWASFTGAHLIGASTGVVWAAGAVGVIFAVLRQRTGSLGAGLGVHLGYYSRLILLAWGMGGG